MSVLVFEREARRLDAFGEGSGTVAVGRDLTAGNNAFMGCGEAVFENCRQTATLPYDEYLFCTDGEIVIELSDRTVRLRPGDAAWLARGTELTYVVGARATAVYAFAPVDWKTAGNRA